MSDDLLRGSTALVTGGAGFIGSHLVDALVARRARVRILDDLSTGRAENLAARDDEVELVVGDLRSPDDCRRAAAGATIVFHLAAQTSVQRSFADPSETISINVGGTANVLAAAREAGARRVVVASSSAVYGDALSIPQKEGEEGRPLSPYALAKSQGEELAVFFCRELGLETLSLRFFNVYGSRQGPHLPYAAVIPLFFRAGLLGQPMRIFGDGMQSRDFVHVGDVVDALLRAATLSVARGEVVNVASGREVTIRALAETVGRLVGSRAGPEHLLPRAGEVRCSLGDTTAAERLLGFRARTSLAAGLDASLDYFRDLVTPASGLRA